MAKRANMAEAALPGLAGPGAEPDHAHHRARLRERFDRAGAEALADYEMLELVLFRAIPRRDVKPLAKRLLREFGDFNHAISAPLSRLLAVEGLGEAAARELKIVEAAAQRLAQARVIGKEALTSWSALMTYCKTRMAHQGVEEFRLLFLDRKNVLIADELQAKGDVSGVSVYPREVAKRALALDASALVMAHNHPSGDPTPSQADIRMTKEVAAALQAVGVVLHDHVVIGKERDASFRALGLI